MEDLYLDVPSPFGLARPTPAWCRVVAAFDPDLRIFPSQTHPLFRLMRKAHQTPIADVVARMQKAQRDGVLKDIHPDTQIAIQYGLVAVFTVPAAIVQLGPERVVAMLRNRDQWAFRDAGAVDDRINENEAAADKAVTDARNRQYLERRRAAGISLLYRTGARVSLVSPRRASGTASLGTPGGNSPATVAPTE